MLALPEIQFKKKRTKFTLKKLSLFLTNDFWSPNTVGDLLMTNQQQSERVFRTSVLYV